MKKNIIGRYQDLTATVADYKEPSNLCCTNCSYKGKIVATQVKTFFKYQLKDKTYMKKLANETLGAGLTAALEKNLIKDNNEK